MIDPEDPNDSRPSLGALLTTPPESGERSLFVSSAPPPPAKYSLGQLIAALVDCGHPDPALSRAVVVEPDGSRISIQWCGACGAMGLPEESSSDWIRPGLLLALREDERLAVAVRDLELVRQGLAGLTKAAQLVGRRLADHADCSSAADVAAAAHELEYGSAEIDLAVRAVLEQLGTAKKER